MKRSEEKSVGEAHASNGAVARDQGPISEGED